MQTIVIAVKVNGILNKAWGELVDAPTKAAATRKANKICKESGFEIETKVQNGNYEYWTVNY